MLTQAMPALASALQGVMPEAAVRQVMQALGNCNQPLEHRGPVSFRPSDQFRQSEPGVYRGGAWNPNEYQSLVDAPQALNNRGFVDTPYTQNRYGDSIYETTNNHFGGDNFLLNTSAEFASNFFQTFFVIGQPGGGASFPNQNNFAFQGGSSSLSFGDTGSYYGRDGVDGAAGLNGVDGAPGANGIDGARGRDGFGVIGPAGRPGEPGRDGAVGAAGRAGVDGFAGPPGRPGRDGLAGGYDLAERGLRRYPVGDAVTDVQVVPINAAINVPTYTFDTDLCDVVEGAPQEIQVPIFPQVNVTRGNLGVAVPTFKLQGKPNYP